MPREPYYEDDDGNDITHTLPMMWEICDYCRGDGSHSNHLGVIQTEDWEPEELDDYMRGAYDRNCEECGGSGKVRVPDHDAMTPDQKRIVEEHDRSDYEFRMIQESERRMGA